MREGEGEGEREVKKENVEIMEYERSPKLPSYRSVAAVNPLSTAEEARPSDDITEEVEPVSIDDKSSETSDDIEDSK